MCGLIGRSGGGSVQEDPGTVRADRHLIVEAAPQFPLEGRQLARVIELLGQVLRAVILVVPVCRLDGGHELCPGTDLVLVDEIHNLNHGTPAGEDLSDHLKYFTEHLPATFIYAGIDVERCGVFTGTRGRQLAGRCELICTGAFPYRDEWAQLIAALEATLRLHGHEPGTLPAQARYLHQRTGGMIGSLTHLVSGLGATVTNVTVNSPTSATVTYNLMSGSSTLLSNQTGTAVYEDGTWKVGDASLCGLLKLVPGGSVPAACSSAG